MKIAIDILLLFVQKLKITMVTYQKTYEEDLLIMESFTILDMSMKS